MILSGPQIMKEREQGRILIEPFDRQLLNPNSYNYRLGSSLIEYDPENNAGGRDILVPADGLVLFPRRLYLGSTKERIGSPCHVVTLLGRSSIGRLGLYLNVTADLGHVGCDSQWTLELHVVQPLRIYADMRIGQVAFWMVNEPTSQYRGRYLYDGAPHPNKDESLTRPQHQESPR